MGYTSPNLQIKFDNVQPLQGGEHVVTYNTDAGVLPHLILFVTNAINSLDFPDKSKNNIFPFLARDFININNINVQEANITIFDCFGKVAFKSNSTNDSTRIDVINLFNGFYMIQVHKGKEIVTKKLVITI